MKQEKGKFVNYSLALIFVVLLMIPLISGCSGGGSGGGEGKAEEGPPSDTNNPLPPENPIVYQVYGIDFSPYIDGQNPDQGSVVSEEQVRKRMEIIAPYAKWMRTFGVSLGVEHAGKVARDLNLETAIGAWLGKNLSANDKEMDKIIDMAKDGLVDLAIIGSETLLRGDLTPAQLIAYIEKSGMKLPGFRSQPATNTPNCFHIQK